MEYVKLEIAQGARTMRNVTILCLFISVAILRRYSVAFSSSSSSSSSFLSFFFFFFSYAAMTTRTGCRCGLVCLRWLPVTTRTGRRHTCHSGDLFIQSLAINEDWQDHSGDLFIQSLAINEDWQDHSGDLFKQSLEDTATVAICSCSHWQSKKTRPLRRRVVHVVTGNQRRLWHGRGVFIDCGSVFTTTHGMRGARREGMTL